MVQQTGNLIQHGNNCVKLQRKMQTESMAMLLRYSIERKENCNFTLNERKERGGNISIRPSWWEQKGQVLFTCHTGNDTAYVAPHKPEYILMLLPLYLFSKCQLLLFSVLLSCH